MTKIYRDPLSSFETATLFRSLINRFGADQDCQSDTPLMATNAWQAFFRAGYNDVDAPEIRSNRDAWVPNDRMITVGRFNYLSFRDIDLMPVWGQINLGYYPQDNRLISVGSVLNTTRALTGRLQSPQRLADMLCKALQEHATQCVVHVDAMMHIMHHREVFEAHAERSKPVSYTHLTLPTTPYV